MIWRVLAGHLVAVTHLHPHYAGHFSPYMTFSLSYYLEKLLDESHDQLWILNNLAFFNKTPLTVVGLLQPVRTMHSLWRGGICKAPGQFLRQGSQSWSTRNSSLRLISLMGHEEVRAASVATKPAGNESKISDVELTDEMQKYYLNVSLFWKPLQCPMWNYPEYLGVIWELESTMSKDTVEWKGLFRISVFCAV